MVEGPDDVSFTYVDPGGAFTMGSECALSNGLAICSATISGEVVTETETADPFIVQAGTTAAPSTPTATISTSTSLLSQPSAQPVSSVQPGSSAQTSENTSSAPSPTKTSNGGRILPPLISGLLLSAITFTLVL
ncbi:hypothetical protein C0991_002953 [Blastosporella zonata]|nr:hypothetical protein C0991_002953 [Blastosporella zonata]